MARFITVTLDGPSGSGKTTIAKSLANKLGYLYVDTGAMYRAVAYYMLDKGIAVDDDTRIESCLADIKLNLKVEDGEQRVILNGNDITGSIRTPEISMAASTVSKNREVRLKLVAMQRELYYN